MLYYKLDKIKICKGDYMEILFAFLIMLIIPLIILFSMLGILFLLSIISKDSECQEHRRNGDKDAKR